MVSHVKVVEYSKLEFREPILVQGLPGLGYVGKITADFLADHLRTVHFAELYSSYLTLQDGNLGISIGDAGSFELPKYDFYAYTDTIPNLIVLTGNMQPISWGQFEVCEEILGLARQRGMSCLGLLGATHVNYPDAVAAKSMVKTLALLFGFSVDYQELDGAMADIESRMRRFGEIRAAALRPVQQPREPEERGDFGYYV